jgi:hypothetical protein
MPRAQCTAQRKRPLHKVKMVEAAAISVASPISGQYLVVRNQHDIGAPIPCCLEVGQQCYYLDEERAEQAGTAADVYVLHTPITPGACTCPPVMSAVCCALCLLCVPAERCVMCTHPAAFPLGP